MIETLHADSIKTVAGLIQLSITPVFLLAGVAGFLNVFTGRLARIVDRLEKLNSYMEDEAIAKTKEDEKITQLRYKMLMKRKRNTNLAILLMSTTGLLTALVMITMFVGFIFGFHHSHIVSSLFVASTASLILALFLFSVEILYTSISINYKKANMP